MSQIPPMPFDSNVPPVLPSTPHAEIVRAIPAAAWTGLGPVGGPRVPYTAEEFRKLYMWFAILLGSGSLLCIVVIGIPALIASIVLHCLILYKAWNQIQDGYQRTDAGGAVGLTFVPGFQLYWYFIAYLGLAKDTNAYMRRYGIQGPAMSEGLALTMAISMCGLMIPYLNLLVVIAVAITDFFFMYQVRNAAMAIAQAKLDASRTLG